MTTHRSTAYVKSSQARHRWRKPEPITNQFRFIVRMAYACHERLVPYDLTWNLADGMMRATITATGNIPMPKPLPKAPKLKIVADWKPAIWDAVYRLEAYHDGALNRMRPGFVIAHSCGLSLVHPCESGELGVTEYGENDDIRQRWFITHTASGRGFGLTLQARDGCPATRGVVPRGLDAGCGRTEGQSRIFAGQSTACRRPSQRDSRRIRPNGIWRNWSVRHE